MGTSVPSKTTSLIGEVRRPILWIGRPVATPGVSGSTRKAQRPASPAERSVVAKTTNTSATGALVMKVLLLQHEAAAGPGRRGLQGIGVGSGPRLGHGLDPDQGAVAEARQVPALRSSVPNVTSGISHDQM